MNEAIHSFITSLHHSGVSLVLAVTGGGASTAAHLLAVPGASRSILEVVIPYAQSSLVEFLGKSPETYCSAQTAEDMAERAFMRARHLAPGKHVVGVSCTAALATDRPKAGDHRFFLGIHTATIRKSYSLTLAKGARDRHGEEQVLSMVLLNAIAETAGIAERLPVSHLGAEVVEGLTFPTEGSLAVGLRNEAPWVCHETDGRTRTTGATPRAVLSGSFNPLHDGHCHLAQVAAKLLALPVAFELSITNVDKPEMTPGELARRLTQFVWRAPVFATRAPNFLRKTELFPDCVFVVGADTATRILDAKYYGHDPEQLRQAMQVIRQRNCRFLVAGRADSSGNFQSPEMLPIPTTFADLFQAIPEIVFRRDVSSTMLRVRIST